MKKHSDIDEQIKFITMAISDFFLNDDDVKFLKAIRVQLKKIKKSTQTGRG